MTNWFVITRVPRLGYKGDQLIYHNIFSCLSNSQVSFNIILISLVPLPNSRISDLHKSTFPIDHVFTITWFQAFCNLLLWLLHCYRARAFVSLQSVLYYSREAAEFISAQSRINSQDKFIFFLIRTALCPSNYSTRHNFYLIDSYSLAYFRRFISEKNYFLKLVYYLIFCIEVRHELHVLRGFRRLIYVSAIDRDFVLSRVPLLERDKLSSKIKILPNGVDTNFFRPRESSFYIAPRSCLIFTGNMNYYPNVNAVQWFFSHVYPLLDKCNILVYIVGSSPVISIVNYSETYSNVIVTGRVDSIAPYLNPSSIFFAPMQVGSGLQNKILEAMSAGMPVITTPIGYSDLCASIDRDLLVADTPEQFAECIYRLLGDSFKAKSLGENARKYVTMNHSWPVLTGDLLSSIS